MAYKINGINSITPKRRLGDNNAEPALKKKAKFSQERARQPKNTAAMLNELRRGLVYKFESQTGPDHAPVFTTSVEIDGQTYLSEGRNKKIAKTVAAAAAFKSFIQFKDGAVLTTFNQTSNVDFTSDEHLENDMNKIKIPHSIFFKNNQ